MRCYVTHLTRSISKSSRGSMVCSSPLIPPRPSAKGLVVRNETTEQRLSRAKVGVAHLAVSESVRYALAECRPEQLQTAFPAAKASFPCVKCFGIAQQGAFVAFQCIVAQGYPYARPATSFIFCNGHAYTFPDSAWVPPNRWQGSLQPLLQLQVTAPDGTSSRCAQQYTRTLVAQAQWQTTPPQRSSSTAGCTAMDTGHMPLIQAQPYNLPVLLGLGPDSRRRTNSAALQQAIIQMHTCCCSSSNDVH